MIKNNKFYTAQRWYAHIETNLILGYDAQCPHIRGYYRHNIGFIQRRFSGTQRHTKRQINDHIARRKTTEVNKIGL